MIEIKVTSAGPTGRVFLTWASVRCSVRKLPEAPATLEEVELRSAGSRGRLLFGADAKQNGAASLKLKLAPDGQPVDFWIRGEFGAPSTNENDAVIAAVDVATSDVMVNVPVMVRIRKNANMLTPDERDRFLQAFAVLNDNGKGPFADFRSAHVGPSMYEAHFKRGFLPWHRAFLLDLERELQAIDDTVALPYWRFDQAAPNVFTKEFMGLPDHLGRLQFTPDHPFNTWMTDGQLGIDRKFANFTATTAPGSIVVPGRPRPLSELETLKLGDQFAAFTIMERSPHGAAHVSFEGQIDTIPKAARDPLFFMLHANVDRLWAKWQWLNKRHDPALAASFPKQPNEPPGHNVGDTMWPWNGVVTPPRPSTAPGGSMAVSPSTVLPGDKPTVASMIDYMGVKAGGELGFAYDDVPFG